MVLFFVLSYCFFIILDLILDVICYTLIIVFFLPLTIYKIFVILLAKLLSPDLIPLSSLDALVAHDFTRSSSVEKYLPYKFNEGATFTIVGDVSSEALRNILQNFLKKISSSKIEYKKYLRLRSTLVIFGGYGFFKPLDKIDFQITVKEETHLIPSEKLNEYKYSWITKPFTKHSPLWEFRILPKVNADETIILFKAHHSILDGYSMFYLLNILFGDNSSEPTSFHAEVIRESIWEKLSCILRFPRVVISYHAPLLFANKLIPISPMPEDDFVIASTQIYFSDLKQIYQKYRKSLTAINIALFLNVVRKSFPSCGHKMISIITPLPFTNHPTNVGKLGNHYCPVILKVPLDENKTISEMISDVDQAIKDCYTKRVVKMAKFIVLPILSVIPVKLAGFLGELSIMVSGVQFHFTTNIAYYSSECDPKNYTIAGCPILRIEPVFSRPFDNIVYSGAMVSHGDRCELTLSSIPDFLEVAETTSTSLLTQLYLNGLHELKIEMLVQ